MKEFTFESTKNPETDAARLKKEVLGLLKNTGNEIAVEVHGVGIGRFGEDEVIDEQRTAEVAEVYSRCRAELIDLLDDNSVQAEAVALFDAFVASEKTAEALQDEMARLFDSSVEHISEISDRDEKLKEKLDVVAGEFLEFLDEKVLENQGNRAEMSKWGNAKLAYEKDDSSSIKEILIDYACSLDDGDEKEKVDTFLELLEQQRFVA